ncbi:8652_t:CDS:2 [Entrophospora sp. SA101]|nr:8652_t:CDS:2 [Entrophospora sp. SA101]
MTQVEEPLVVTSLQTALSDQAFAMHGLTQFSDIQTVLKEMHDKKEIQDEQGVQDKQETLTQSQSIDSSMSGQNSRQGSRAASRAPSRSSSRAGSRAVSPSNTPVPLSRTNSSSRMKSDLPSTPESPGINPYIINKEAIPIIDEKKNEKDVDDASQLVAMIKQAEEAVEVPVRGRETKPRQPSNASETSQLDFDNFLNDLDTYLEEDGEEVAGEGLIKPSSKENTDLIQDRKKEKRVGHSKQKSRQEEEFQQSLDVFAKNFNNILAEIEHEVGGNDDANILNGEIMPPNMLSSQYIDPINHPSEDLADLDDFAQQCRLLTRALILPFLHATHSFMSESLQTTDTSHTPRSVTSTTRSFMNLMYWTFLFTLGTLVLDAWLCEVAGQQVIRMVGMLKPGQVFHNIDKNNNIEHHHHNAIELDHQDGEAKMEHEEEDRDLNIPGSFPSAFKWTPHSSHLNNNKKDNVRRVKSVVLRRPKRNGSFSGGGHWVIRTQHYKDGGSNKFVAAGGY